MGNKSLENTELLRQYAESILEVPIFGIAETERLWFHPEVAHLKSKLPFVVVIGYKLSYGVTETLINGPNRLYLAHYRQLNYLLDKAATQLAMWLEMRGAMALPIPASQIMDWQNQLGHLSHRHAAVAAGIAFWGRNNLAITPQFGAHQRWASILTDFQMLPGKPLNMDCGNCRACILSCPAKAIGETRDQWDYEKCYALLTEFSKQGISQHICGMCIKPCRGKILDDGR